MTDQVEQMSGYGHGQLKIPPKKVDTSPHVQHPPDKHGTVSEPEAPNLLKSYSVSDLKVLYEHLINLRTKTISPIWRDTYTKTMRLVNQEFSRRIAALLIK